MRGSDFLTKEEQSLVVSTIKEAELETSGEIRVHIESKCKADLMQRAVYIFNYLKMYKTAARNGVLIYIDVSNKRFAIIGDCGINSKVPPDFWDGIKDVMTDLFKKGEFCKGICSAIRMAGKELKSYFPYQKDDVNEQPDDISFGE